MADCFWTDMVGCIEDCGSAPVAGYFLWNTDNGGASVTRGFYFGETLSEADGSDGADCPPVSKPAFLDVSIIHLKVYIHPDDDFSNCGWTSTVPATHGETADTPLEGCFDGNTWKPESFYASTAGAAASVDVNYAIPNDGDYPLISFNDLCTLAGLSTGNNGAFKATIRNNATGKLYEGGGVQATCF